MLLLGGWTVSSETDTQTTQANQLWGTDTDEQTVTDTGVQTGSELLLTAESDQQPTLSVVMPTLNEEAGIAECIDRTKTAIAELGVPAEIIISDSSSDRTPEIAEEMGAIVVEPDRPGYGYAYRYAFDRARGEYIAIGDADTTYDFRQLPKLVHRLLATDSDLVLGSRLNGDIKPGAMPALHQYVGNPLLTRFLNSFYQAGVSDAHSGLRVFTADSIETLNLRSGGMEFASEMIMEASARGLAIEEVPITYHEREGDATLDSFRDGWRHVRFMLANAPGYLFSLPGVVLTTVGTVVMALAFFSVQLPGLGAGGVSPGVRSMVAGGLLTIVGYQAASLGVFSTLASDPVRRPDDRVTNWIVTHISLERGGLVGLGLFAGGGAYAVSLLYRWMTGGYEMLPALTHDVLAFVVIMLGVQTIFSSFFIHIVEDTGE